MNLQLGDIVCLKNPQATGGGKALTVSFLMDTKATVRIIHQGLPLTYTVALDDLHLLVPCPLGKVTRVRFEDFEWKAYERAHTEGVAKMKELGLARA
jgi:hypothetical protein